MRKLSLLGMFSAVIAVLSADPVVAQTLYGITFQGVDGPSTLVEISTTNGAATVIGAVGFERCSGMDFNAAGTLYATCERSDGSDIGVLVTIDPATGIATEIGPTGIDSSISDISFRPVDGALFAYNAFSDPQHTLYTINTNTGAATFVGDTGLGFASGNGMAFDLSGTLLQSQFTGGPSPDLNTLNTTTGQAIFVGQISPLTTRFGALEVHPTTGVIFGALNTGSGGGGPTLLATINTATLTATAIGTTANGLDAIAFAPAPVPRSVPVIDALGLAGLMLLLAAVGVRRISKPAC